MSDKTYNGWTNYATWRVNLEIFDGFDPYDYFSDYQADIAESLPESLKEYAEQVIFECGECNPQSLAGSYALAFLSDVNWFEIAKHMITNYADEVEA